MEMLKKTFLIFGGKNEMHKFYIFIKYSIIVYVHFFKLVLDTK